MKRYFSETGVLRAETLNQILNLIMELNNNDVNQSNQYYLTFFVDRDEGVSELEFGEVDFDNYFSTNFKDKDSMSKFILNLQKFVENNKQEKIEDAFEVLFEDEIFTTKEKELILEYVKSIKNKREKDDED